MEVFIAILIAMAAAIVIGILGLVGQAHSKEEERLHYLQEHYKCQREAAVELLHLMRKSKMHHVLKRSGLTL